MRLSRRHPTLPHEDPPHSGVVVAAWSNTSAGAGAVIGGRPCLVTPNNVVSVNMSGSREGLPLACERCDDHGRAIRLWELPAVDIAADTVDVAAEQTLELHWLEGSQTLSRSIALTGLGRLTAQAQEELAASSEAETEASPSAVSAWHEASDASQALVSMHVGFIDALSELNSPTDALSWPRRTGPMIRDAEQVIDQWCNADRPDQPWRALIVRLAEEEERGHIVTRICERPRRVLMRTRESQSIARVQQVDSACLRWLARQPGYSVTEKAGPQQRVLAITRQETADTLENRVVRDFLVRAIRAGVRYVREHARSGSERVTLVRKYVRKLRQLLVSTEIAQARALTAIPEPNYVLQFDQRYHRIWDNYQQLIHEERVLDKAWQWRQRIWSETCLFAALAGLETLRQRGGASRRGDFCIHPEQTTGTFVTREAPPSSIPLSHGKAIDIITSWKACSDYDARLTELGSWGPDLVLGLRHGGQLIRAVGIWTALHFGLPGAIALPARCSAVNQGDVEIQSLLITPSVGTSEILSPWHVQLYAAHPQSGLGTLGRALEQLMFGASGDPT